MKHCRLLSLLKTGLSLSLQPAYIDSIFEAVWPLRFISNFYEWLVKEFKKGLLAGTVLLAA
jgi:hypothetical protein